MISQMRDGKLTLEIPIVYGMVSSKEPWLDKEVKEIVKKVRADLERAGFLFNDSYYKSDCEWGTIVIWAELPVNPENYYYPKLGNFWDEEKQRTYLNIRKLNQEKTDKLVS